MLQFIDEILENWNDLNYTGLSKLYNNKFEDKTYEDIIQYKTSIDLQQVKNIRQNKKLIDSYEPTSEGLLRFLNDHNFHESKKMSKDITIYRMEGGTKKSYIKHYDKFIKSDMKYVMEIGFNAGLSAINFLEKTEGIVLSFDLMLHDYCWYAKMFIDMKYPGRHILISGDSMVNVKAYSLTSSIKFDLIFIDGYHSVNYAYNDLLNSKSLANENTIIILDNVSPHNSWGLGPYIAMNKLLYEAEIIFLKHVELGVNYEDGFAVLKYNFLSKKIPKILDIDRYKQMERLIPIYILTAYIDSVKKVDKDLVLSYIKKFEDNELEIDDMLKNYINLILE